MDVWLDRVEQIRACEVAYATRLENAEDLGDQNLGARNMFVNLVANNNVDGFVRQAEILN